MSVKNGTKTCVAILIASAILLSQCKGRDESYNNTVKKHAMAITKMLNLTNDQMRQLVDVLNDNKNTTSRDRAKYSGDNEALLKAAKARDAAKVSRIESFLTDEQKAKFKEMREKKNLTDKAIIFAERLGFNCMETEKIAEIVMRAPSVEEAAAVKKSGNPEKIKAFTERTSKIHQEIEALLRNDEQKLEFQKMIREHMEMVDQIVQKG